MRKKRGKRDSEEESECVNGQRVHKKINAESAGKFRFRRFDSGIEKTRGFFLQSKFTKILDTFLKEQINKYWILNHEKFT